jgi:hypothetical protein
MQAMINTAWISFDPMTNGQKLSGTMGLYGKSSSTGSKQSEGRFGKAEFEIEQRSFGEPIKPMCAK